MGRTSVQVSLGVDSRNPSSGGQANLLKAGIGQLSEYELVDIYNNDLEEFKYSINSLSGGFSWITGNRGSGKSEVISHLIRNQIKEHGERERNPKLPLYISVGAGGIVGDLTFDRIDSLARKAISDSFAVIRNQIPAKSNLYKKLRTLLTDEKGYSSFQSQINQDYLIMEGLKVKNTLAKALQVIDNLQSGKNALRVTLYIDDLDKIDPNVAARFLSSSQQNLAELTNAKVRIVCSVSNDFMEEARDNPGLNFCGLQNWVKNPTTILQIPDLSDLTTEQLHELIMQRTRYLHLVQDGPIPEWVADFGEKPHELISDVLEHEDWKSYDIREMRKNAAIFSLIQWQAKRKLPHVRDTLRAMDNVLKNCPAGFEKTPLTSKVLESFLKNNDDEEKSAIVDEINRRMKDPELSTIYHEELHEWELKLKKDFWNKALEATNQRITLGVWDDELLRNLGIRKVGDSKKPLMRFLDFAIELCEKDSGILPSVLARTPDDLFSLIGYEEMAKILKNLMIVTPRRPKKKSSRDKKSGKQRLERAVRDLQEEDYFNDLLNSDFSTMLNSESITPGEEQVLAKGLFTALVGRMIETKSKTKDGRVNRTTKEWEDFIVLIEVPELYLQASRTLQQHLAYFINMEDTNPQKQAQDEFFTLLITALKGTNTHEFLTSNIHGENSQFHLFDSILDQTKQTGLDEWAKYVAESCNRNGPPGPGPFELISNAGKLSSSKRITADILKQDKIVEQTIEFKINLTNEFREEARKFTKSEVESINRDREYFSIVYEYNSPSQLGDKMKEIEATEAQYEKETAEFKQERTDFHSKFNLGEANWKKGVLNHLIRILDSLSGQIRNTEMSMHNYLIHSESRGVDNQKFKIISVSKNFDLTTNVIIDFGEESWAHLLLSDPEILHSGASRGNPRPPIFFSDTPPKTQFSGKGGSITVGYELRHDISNIDKLTLKPMNAKIPGLPDQEEP